MATLPSFFDTPHASEYDRRSSSDGTMESLTMRPPISLAKHWPALLAGVLTLGALALLWRVRDTPLALGAFARFDALSAFFLCALFGGIALALAARPHTFSPRWLRPAAAAGALALAYSTTLTLAIACAYLALGLLTVDWQALATPEGDRRASPAKRALRALRRACSPVALWRRQSLPIDCEQS